MTTPTEFTEAVNAVRQDSYAQPSLDLLAKIVSQGDGSKLVSDLIARERISTNTEEEAVSATMRHLEALVLADPAIACMLMANLVPMADELFMHHVVDAIHLCISYNKSNRVASYLRQLALSTKDPELRRFYDVLIKSSSET